MSGPVKLPETWIFALISDVADVNRRSFCPLPNAVAKPVHFVPMSAVTEEFGGIDVSSKRPLGDVQKGYTSFLTDDVLFAKITPCMENGKLAVVPPLQDHIAYGSTEFHVLHAKDQVQPNWLAYFLSQSAFRRLARQNMTGSAGQLRVATTWLANALIPVAPAAEQTRIVAKLEELLSDLDAGVAELKAAQKKLAQYRQSLLKAAVEGALTAEWRAEHAPLSPCGRGVGGEGAHTPATLENVWLQARARELRKQQTAEEHALWQQLRAKRFSGWKFRRQQPLGRFIVDFVCFAQRLIVELDGGQHAQAAEYDKHRDDWLKQQGFRVLRFWNNEWSMQQETVLEAIWQALQRNPPLPNPSSARGEGLENADGPAPLSPRGRGAGGEGETCETGAQLLERILSERRARWEAKQLAKFKEQGKTPPKDWQKKYPEPVQPDTTDLPELPEGWVWASVDQLTELITSGSRGWADFYGEAGATFIRAQNLNKDWLDLSEIAFVNPPGGSEGERTRVQRDDVLLTITGANVGKAARVEMKLDEAYVSQHVALIRVVDPGLSEVLHLFLTAETGGRGQLNKEAYGAGKPGLNLRQVAAVSMPLPGAPEIRALLSAVAVQLKAVDGNEVAITAALKQSTAQRQNILRAAFAGQLVPQDPNDEPASVLLARIRAERAAQSAMNKPLAAAYEGRKARHEN